MIGKVTWPGGKRSAILHEDGRWEVPGDDLMAESLAVSYADAYRGPQDGPYGVAILNDLASRVGGTIRLEPKKPAPPGTVF